MPRVCLIHWNLAEAEERARRLTALDHEVTWKPPTSSTFFRELRADPPDAVVIDLSRLPTQGRDFGLAIRQIKALRHVPLVFLEGAPEKVARIRELLPDAVYGIWEEIGDALAHAVSHPPQHPVVPSSRLAGYAGTPLAKKLGIEAGRSVALAGAPERFEESLGQLPEGVVIRRDPPGRSDLILWFTRSRDELEGGVAEMGALAGAGGLWIIWPKIASRAATDLTQSVVREVGLAAGLVDYKVCAVDETWSGLRFTRRKSTERR